jgi:hypothetical protein
MKVVIHNHLPTRDRYGWTNDVEVYHVSTKTGRVTASSIYSAKELRDTFGGQAEKLLNGGKVYDKSGNHYNILKSAYKVPK